MFAVVEIAGEQFQAEPNAIMAVPLLEGEVGTALEFNNILMASDDNGLQIGAPYITGSVKVKILEHFKGERVLIFHKKRRKGHRKLNGHRQKYTKIEITDVKF